MQVKKPTANIHCTTTPFIYSRLGRTKIKVFTKEVSVHNVKIQQAHAEIRNIKYLSFEGGNSRRLLEGTYLKGKKAMRLKMWRRTCAKMLFDLLTIL